jgi:4-hydroxy-4-methyl-2-oxoglutarate aldolase
MMADRSYPTGADLAEICADLAVLSTPVVSDAIDRYFPNGRGLAGLRSWGYSGSMIAGPAFTVSYRDVTSTAAGTVGDYIDDVIPGSVVVIVNRGRTDCTVWGDLLTRKSHRAGLVATVIDGVFRDVEVAESLGYPIYARDSFMVTGKDRVAMEATMVPVTFGDVTIEPGDIICADRSGVVAVPYGIITDVLRAATEIAAAESRIIEMIEAGGRLDRARQEVGYHQLQQRRSIASDDRVRPISGARASDVE